MTKKDFELIAREIRDGEYIGNPFETRASIAKRLASSLAKTNPKFDKARFLKACGVDNHIHDYNINDVLKDYQGKGGYACQTCGKVK